MTIDSQTKKEIKKMITDYIDNYATENQYGVSKIPYHTHNGTDSPLINAQAVPGNITISDGSTTISGVDEIIFAGATVTDDGDGTVTVTIAGGRDWQFTGVFSPSSSSVVAWTAGTLLQRDGTSRSIVAGNTGTMTALTYIYFNPAVSTTVLQTTTVAATAVGSGKILIGIANMDGSVNTGVIFSDNFNSYTLGALNGQGGWGLTSGTAYTVENTTVYEGANAVSSGTGSIEKNGTAQADGMMTFYVRGPALTGGYIFLRQGANKKVWIDINSDVPGFIAYYDNGLGTWANLAPWTTNKWYAVQVQWRSSDHTARFNVNGGTWTNWVNPSLTGAWTTGMDIIQLQDGLGSGGFFFDTFQGGLYSGGATYQIYGGSGGIGINASNISLSSVSGNLLAEGSVPASALVGTDIATVGTITTGTWNGTVISPLYGGTGIANNVAMTVTGSGNFAYTRTLVGVTNVTFPTTGTLATLAGVETFTNKRITPRVVSMADANSFTPTGDTADINFQPNTQTAGNLTANAPTGTPTNGQILEIVIKSTNVQTFVWNAIYTGSTTTPLPTASTGGTSTDKFFFQYNTDVSKWQIFNAQYGY